ncbi:aminomethyl-transferring glycine dehydrogenase subunit GcvPB, partial [bacterium]|nr:aminomethyl-transferring glycine dehydrogenase subunit GcvPB [bacterium]
LPIPRVVKEGDTFRFDENYPESIGRMMTFYGHFGVMVRAYSYILSMGADGLKKVSQHAVLNANYIKEKLKDTYHLPYDRPCMHECVFSDANHQSYHISTLDIAKRLIDYGFHPPTIYFPLVVKGAMMIEPTETESEEELDRFIHAMKSISDEAKENPELLKNAPSLSKVRRLDETTAARKPCLSG